MRKGERRILVLEPDPKPSHISRGFGFVHWNSGLYLNLLYCLMLYDLDLSGLAQRRTWCCKA